MTYSKKLKDPRWQKKRLEIFKRDEWTCQICGDTETELQVHHKNYSGEPWEAKTSSLTTICKHCHLLIHWFDFDINEFIRVHKKPGNGSFDAGYILLYKEKNKTCFQQYLSIRNDEILPARLSFNQENIKILKDHINYFEKNYSDGR